MFMVIRNDDIFSVTICYISHYMMLFVGDNNDTNKVDITPTCSLSFVLYVLKKFVEISRTVVKVTRNMSLLEKSRMHCDII